MTNYIIEFTAIYGARMWPSLAENGLNVKVFKSVKPTEDLTFKISSKTGVIFSS